jgi:hypothetical protein
MPTATASMRLSLGLPLQSFDSANLFGQTFVYRASPLTSMTNDAVFAAGSILPGLKIKTLRPGSVSTALLVYAGGPVGATSVGNNWFGDTLVLELNPAVSAVCGTVFGNTAAGPSFAGKISVAFFSGKRILGGKTFSEAYNSYVFFGVSSSTLPITRVQITWASDEDADTFLSNFEFGTPH